MILIDLGIKYILEYEITVKNQKTIDMNLLGNFNFTRINIKFLISLKCQCHSLQNTICNIHGVLN